jgi:hypothetical protein
MSKKTTVNAPISKKLRCMVSGHDWRRTIGPRDGFFERCRRCYSTRMVDEHARDSVDVGTTSGPAA